MLHRLPASEIRNLKGTYKRTDYMLLRQPIRQIAYVVPDVREAAARHSALYGSGPFIVGRLPEIPTIHRGDEGILEMTAGFGQWGSMQVEFLQQHGSAPSILRENLNHESKMSLHHFACIVDDIDDAVEELKKSGKQEVSRIFTSPNPIVFIDTVQEHGCFLELLSGSAVTTMYDFVAELAADFDGRNPVREWDFTQPN